MQYTNKPPQLYGISERNSDRTSSNLWGKNQFNSTFPLSLCLYMRDKKIDPVSVIVENGETVTNDCYWKMHDIVGKTTEEPYFFFEKKFEGYERMIEKINNNKIDLIVKLKEGKECPYEIKLTVVPDSSTANLSETSWGPELVMRSVSSAYAMMGVALSINNDRSLREIAIDAMSIFNMVTDWYNREEVSKYADELTNTFDEVMKFVEPVQKPFLIQPVWKTIRQSHELSKHCFDVFVWSDVAVLKLPIFLAKSGTNPNVRALRDVIQNGRALYEILTQGAYNYEEIYRNTPSGKQTDKAYKIVGKQISNYLSHPQRLHNPTLGPDILKKIVLNGGENELKPERRLDMAVKLYMKRGGDFRI